MPEMGGQRTRIVPPVTTLTTPKPDPHLLSGSHWAGLRIGILGGSFNPAHAGHLHVAQQALMRLGLDQVWLLVSPQNPLKSTREMAPLQDRVDSARKISAKDPRIIVTAIETDLNTRYTAQTLRGLQRRYPRTGFIWLMGADNLLGFHRWQDWQYIAQTIPIAVFARLPYSIQAINGRAACAFSQYRRRASALKGLGSGPRARKNKPDWAFVPSPINRLSATAIRAALNANPDSAGT
ncbi:MAG: nicotinate-nucleotide adenylyltransferase [Alphaproteobacteria bacterium]